MQTRFLTILPGLLTTALFSAALVADVTPLNITAERAPVAADGTTVGRPTDFVLTFRDIDPGSSGIDLLTGGTVEVKLSDEFTNLTGGGTLVMLQGWPQSPPAPPPFLWTTETAGNRVTATMTDDFKVGAFGPGTKQVHLILLGFANPMEPGVYPIELTIRPAPMSDSVFKGTANVRIIPDARPSVNPISLFSGPPGPPPPFFNPLYQNVGLGEQARQVGLYLWGSESVPLLGVDLTATTQPSHYQLTQNSSVVGEVWITAPAGAEAYSLASVSLSPGGPPSVEIPAFVTAQPVGLLGVQFSPDPSVFGDYEIAISMLGGNEKTLYVAVAGDDVDGKAYTDSNGNGLIDAGEPGEVGLNFTLYHCAPPYGVAGVAVSTAPDGLFSFSNVMPGEYQLGVELADRTVAPVRMGEMNANQFYPNGFTNCAASSGDLIGAGLLP